MHSSHPSMHMPFTAVQLYEHRAFPSCPLPPSSLMASPRFAAPSPRGSAGDMINTGLNKEVERLQRLVRVAPL